MLGIRNSGHHRRLLSFVLGFLLLYSLLAVYFSKICYRDPSSIFWRPEETRLLSYSAFRQAQAHKLADQADKHELTKWDNNTPPQLCVGIGSVNRHGYSYLRQTLGSILEGLDELERRQIYIAVFLAHSNQSRHEDSAAAWLRNMADSLPSYPEQPDLLRLVEKLEVDSGYPAHARKQKIDYSVLLAECTKTAPAYIMTLEDDVIALDGWFHRTLSALRTAERKTQEMGREHCTLRSVFGPGQLHFLHTATMHLTQIKRPNRRNMKFYTSASFLMGASLAGTLRSGPATSASVLSWFSVSSPSFCS